jgi:MerR family transcriptional regulator, heat shock protein HspR
VKRRAPDTPVYVISVAAELIGCHPRTLRIYEERGLLSPVRRRRIRLYSERDIQRVRLIRYLTEERGLNLAGVQMVLEIQAHYHEEFTWVFGEGFGEDQEREPHEAADRHERKADDGHEGGQRR